MLSASIREKLAARATELDDIQNRIAALTDEKRGATAAVQAALKEKNADGIIAARQVEDQLGREIEALGMIANEIARTPAVDREVFQQEFAEFNAQQKQILNKAYAAIMDQISRLDSDRYYDYEQTYQQYVAQLIPWQNLAAKIGANQPAELRSQILNPTHKEIRRVIARLRTTGGI